MKVLLIAVKDWANLGYELSQCLKAVGVDAICIAKAPHTTYNFDPGPKIYKSFEEVHALAKKADIIIFLHSDNTTTGAEKDFNKKGIVVFHGGSAYRKNPLAKNKQFYNKVKVDLTLIQTVDLLGLPGSVKEKEVWLLPPINTENLKAKFNSSLSSRKRIIAHYPSRASTKGTVHIKQVMAKLKNDPALAPLFEYRTGGIVKYQDNLKRVSECDIYLECVMPKIENAIHGEWGMAALEAAAMGKVVVTNFFSSEKYKKEYGPHPIQVANDFEVLERQLERLILMPEVYFKELQVDTRDWVVKYHSYKAVGERLLKIFYERLNWEGK